MTTREQLIKEIEQAPDSLVEELFDLLASIKQRHLQNDTAQANDPNNKPIWEIAQALTQDMTDEEVDRLPKDGAEQHDHYIYGTPKREA